LTRPRNVLVVYAFRRWPLRTAIADHLYSFARHAPPGTRVFHLNVATRGVPGYLRRVPWDLVVFHTLLLGARWRPDLYERFLRRAEPLRHLDAVKVALPQDEFLDVRRVEAFVRDFGVSHLFSVMPESEWKVVYPELDRSRVQLHRVLTGYLDDGTLRRIEALQRKEAERPIDIGYRAWHAAPWLGRHGRLKVLVAQVIGEAARRRGLRCDLSTAEADTLYGDDWLRFLLRCRYTIGVDGGASILDRDGSVREQTDRYCASRPDASFEEVEAACFPGRDGEARLVALSPRHLEACATRTCQVLVEGDYNGVLRPGVHYIPVAPDLSDAEEVVTSLGDEARRGRITEQAYRDVVASGHYSYRRLVEQVLSVAVPSACRGEPGGEERAHRRSARAERLSWLAVRVAFGSWHRLDRLLPLEALRRRWGNAPAAR
jgi:hypothetical protein